MTLTQTPVSKGTGTPPPLPREPRTPSGAVRCDDPLDLPLEKLRVLAAPEKLRVLAAPATAVQEASEEAPPDALLKSRVEPSEHNAQKNNQSESQPGRKGSQMELCQRHRVVGLPIGVYQHRGWK